MEMPVGPCSWSQGVTDWQRELADAELPGLRLFTVAHRPAAEAQDELDGLGSWQVCTKDIAAAFSATAFFFARALQRQRGEPLGIVVSCWGGTVCEAWTSGAGLRDFPEFAPALARLAEGTPEQLQHQRAAFWDAVQKGDPIVGGRRPEAGDFDDAAWPTAQVPQPWSDAGLGAYDGVLWYRRSVDVPAAWAGRDLLLQFGPIDDMDTVWFAGERVGGEEQPGHWQEPRSYRVPGALVRAGRAAIAVRVVDTGGEGGCTGSAEAMRLSPQGGDGGGLELGGSWRCARGAALALLPAWPQPIANRPNEPSVLWNGMIAPLRSFPFRGSIWYQGESNRERAAQYAQLFPAMIRDWRAAFGRELPFLFVQIAPFGYGGDRGELFELRRAQEQALALPATGMAPSTDVGDVADIHPLQKRPLGERLAALALARAYGRSDVACEPPRPAHVARDGTALRLTFAPAAGGMRAPAAGPAHFELEDDDGVFHPARARLDGDDVVLQCDAVAVPRGARYCHAAAAIGDLRNGVGWPVVPFELHTPR